MRYRKLPVEVEAFQMTAARRYDNSEWPHWLHEAWNKPVTEKGALFHNPDGCLEEEPTPLFIQTLEGTQKVSFGDYIIQGVAGEINPCKPDIFEKTYEKVDSLKEPPALENTEPPLDYKERYLELLHSVTNVCPGESRHQTALRYIRQSEEPSNQSECCEQPSPK